MKNRILTSLLAFWASLIFLVPATAGADITVSKSRGGGVVEYTIPFKNTDTSLSTISDPIPACGEMLVFFTRSSAAIVGLYEVEPADDTYAEVTASTLVKLFIASGKTEFQPTLGAVRFAVVTKESSAVPSEAKVICSNTLAKGKLELVPSVTSISAGDSFAVDPNKNIWNSIDPNVGNSGIVSTCGSDKPCLIGSTTERATCTDLYSTCTDLYDDTRNAAQTSGSPDTLCDSDGATPTLPQSTGAPDGLCDDWGVSGITAYGPNPNFTPSFNGYGSSWPNTPAYPLADGLAGFSAIQPGSYDDVVQAQAASVTGNHNLVGPQSGGALGGSGHVGVLGSINAVVGEIADSVILGYGNLLHFAISAMFPSDGAGNSVIVLGKGNVQDSRTVTPASAHENVYIGNDNTVTGAVRNSTIVGENNVITGDPAGQDISQRLSILGASNGAIGPPTYQIPPTYTWSVPSYSSAQGNYPDVWMTGQRVFALPGYNAIGTTTPGGLQEWWVMLRRNITGTGKTALQTIPGGGGSLYFNKSGLWRWDIDVTCYDSAVEIDAAGAVQPAVAAWHRRGVAMIRDWNNDNTLQQMRLFTDGTEGAPTIGHASPILPTPLIAFDANGATPTTSWALEIAAVPTSAELRVSVTSSAGDDLNCNALVHVVEMRNP